MNNDRIDRRLGDFTTKPRVLVISLIAAVVAVAALFAGMALLGLIRFCTNLAYLGKFSFANLNLGDHSLPLSSVLVPVIGALIVGLMARYGSDKIRGHGIPRGDRSDHARPLAARHQGGYPQADLVGNRDRHRRPVWRRGADHHDGRRNRLADRAGAARQRQRA